MIKRYVFLLLFSLSLSHAYFMTQNSYGSYNKILQNFDVDIEFIKNSMYSSEKQIADHYKTKYFLKTLQQGYEFIPMIKSMIEKNKVPEIILYLAMAESNFSPNALSKQKASGLWQFIPSTASKFGLKINEYIDERRDPIKSTQAAIKYLKYLHKSFGKWYLAAMAYNCGETKLRKAILEAGSDDLKTLLDSDKKYLPGETRHYINKIISIAAVSSNANFMLENERDYLLNQGSSQVFDTVLVPSATSLASIAQSIGISANKLKSYNPQLMYYFTPPNIKSYHIYIPYGKRLEFQKNFNPKNNYNGFYVHVVKNGENLSKIGAKYKVKYSLIKQFNNLKSNSLKLKQKLIIPTIIKEKPQTYVVRKGDTLDDISKKFSVQISEIKKQNNIQKYIKPGDKIVIPTK